MALILIMTSQAMAVARGTTGPAGQMVLCTGTGPALIYVDQNGTPTGPPVYCPDCALADLTAVAQHPQFVAFELTIGSAEFPTRQMILRISRGPEFARARAPPVTV